LAVAQRAGVASRRALRALAGVHLQRAWQRAGDRQHGRVDDTYNANPASMRRAVQTRIGWRGASGGPFVVVVGTMLELGPESARLHAEAAREIAHRKPALVAAVGTFARVFESLREALAAGCHGGGRRRLGPKLNPRCGARAGAAQSVTRIALERVLNYLDLMLYICSRRLTAAHHFQSLQLHHLPRRGCDGHRAPARLIVGPRSSRSCVSTGSGKSCAPRVPRVITATRHPTMGGLIIILATVVPTLLWARLDSRYVIVTSSDTVDGVDRVPRRLSENVRGQSQGLVARWKLVGQVSFGLGLGSISWCSPSSMAYGERDAATLLQVHHLGVAVPI